MMKRIIIVLLFLLVVMLPSVVFAATQSAEVLAPDLTVSDISFAPENPVMGQPVNISAIIHNIGDYMAKNVTADFYIDGTSIVRKEIDEVPSASQKSVSINYIFLSAGYHNITIKINASNTQKEVQASKTIYVSSPSPTISPGGGGGGALLYFTPTPTPAHPPPSLIISNISVTIEEDSVIISWDTNEKSDSRVKCGMKCGQYTIKEYNASYVFHHAIPVKQIPLKNIFENTTYYFIVNSTDPRGNSAQTEEYIFILTPPEREREIIPFILQLPQTLYPHMWWILLAIIIFMLIIALLIIPGHKSRRTFNSLTEKPLGTEVLMYLFTTFPKVSRPVDIAKQVGVDLNGVLEGLHTLSNKNKLETLLGTGLVDKVEREGEACYRISKRGKSLMKSLK